MNRRLSIFCSGQETQAQLIQLDELSNELDQNLRTLALFQPFSDTEKPLLAKGAFLRSNKSAFHYVIKYLIMFINPIRFRKRFRWPVATSSDESAFRTETHAYFNECHAQFKWNFGPFKMQVCLFPGGIEFMKIIVELTKIAMRTVLKEHDAMHLLNSGGITLIAAQTRLRAAEEAFELMDQWCGNIRSKMEPIKEKTKRLKAILSHILSKTSISPNMMNSDFLSAWESNQLCRINEITRSFTELEKFVANCESFEEKLSMIKCQPLNFDKEKMQNLNLLEATQHFDAQINYEKLFVWIKNIMPELINVIYFKPPWSLKQLKRESQLLDKYLLRAHNLLSQIDALGMNQLLEKERTAGEMNAVSIYYLNDKLILTPIIKCQSKKDYRIAIWDAMPAVDSPVKITSYNLPKMNEGCAKAFEVNDCGQTMSTKLDAISILNTVTKRSGFIKSLTSPHRPIQMLSPSNRKDKIYNSTVISKENRNAANANTTESSVKRKALYFK